MEIVKIKTSAKQLLKKWQFRYCLAIGLSLFGYLYFDFMHRTDPLTSIEMVVLALWLPLSLFALKETAIILLVLLGAAVLFKGIHYLEFTVPLSIIIGAMIIGYAIHTKK